MNTDFLYPVLVQVLLTFVLIGATGGSRFLAIRSGRVKPQDVALGERAWPKRSLQFSNAYHNQLETPILFYAGVLFAGVFGVAGTALLVLAWAFVILRLVHCAIHVTSNHMLYRFMAFGAASLILCVFWIVLAVSVLTR